MTDHWHIHDDSGACYGDSQDRAWALYVAAAQQADWRTTWGMAPVTVIDAPHCIDQCRIQEDNA